MAEEQAPTTESKDQATIYQEVFGSDFKGAVDNLKAPAETEPTEQAEPPAEVQETEAEEIQAETPEDPGTEETDTTAETEPESEPIQSLDELLEMNQYDPEWFNSLEVALKVDGETSTATLKDLVDKYQINLAAEKRLEAAKAEKQKVAEEYETRSKAIEEQFVIAGELVKAVEALITADESNINWADLQENDPADYAAKKLQIRERREALDKIKSDAVQKYQEASKPVAEADLNEQRALIGQETQKIRDAFPDWKDDEAFQTGMKGLATYLISKGFPQDAVMNTNDGDLLVLAEKARRFDEQSQKADVAKKKVVKAPKTMGPGKPKTKSQLDLDAIERESQRMREQGGTLDDYVRLNKMKKAN